MPYSFHLIKSSTYKLTNLKAERERGGGAERRVLKEVRERNGERQGRGERDNVPLCGASVGL